MSGSACERCVRTARFVVRLFAFERGASGQLMTMQNGTSAGANAALMKKVVVNLSEDDIIALSAYLGSLPPR
jgi:hypothetical protein